MQIAKVQNGAVTQIGDYKELFPQTSFPASGPSAEWMQAHGVLPVTVFKAHDSSHKLTPAAPYIENGQVFTVQVSPKSDAELNAELDSAKARVRAQRDALLAKTDWTQAADAPVNATTWATYRQALRDITKQAGFPNNVEWPEPPDAPEMN